MAPPPVAGGGMLPPPIVSAPPVVTGFASPSPGPIAAAVPPMVAAPPMVPPMVSANPIERTFDEVAPARTIPDAQGAPVLVGFLVTFQNEPTGKFWPIRSGRASLGRAGVDNEAEIALQDASTSARHAVLSSDPSTGMAYVEDTGSRNGTFVNEHRLQPGAPHQLHDNDRLRLGSITLVVKLLAS